MGNNDENTEIATDIEVVAQNAQQHVWHHLIQHKGFEQNTPKVMVKGEGLRERIAKAVYEQIKTMNFFGNMMGNVPSATYAKMLTDKMPGLDRVYFSNSGSEANEKAFKIVRQISHAKHGCDWSRAT